MTQTTSAPPDKIPGKSEFHTRFENPPIAYRGKPFWCWNGKLNKEELIRQIGVFEKMGMSGFFMHSRTGLRNEYLGDEWFSLIDACAKEADRRGLEAWLYDEDRWPSGSAGGLATQDVRYRMRYMRMHTLNRYEDLSDRMAGFIEAFVAVIDGLHLKTYREVEYVESTELNSDEVFLVFTWEYAEPSSFYNGSTYLNTLDRSATEQFIEITHNAYKKRNGQHFGNAIKGIFTDEPHRGFVMCDRHDQPSLNDGSAAAPYTDSLFEVFEKRFLYSLRARLPELFLRYRNEPISPVKWAYMECIQQLFLDNWAKPLHAWCQEHNLELTGHVLHEDSLSAQAIPCGSVMRYYPHMDRPGIDILGNNNLCYHAAKQVDSAARQFGQKWRLSELYGCSGWGFDFTGHKHIGDWQALLGINLRCHHLSWYTMAGEAKRDYPASIFFQSAWFEEYKHVESYYSRLSQILQLGRPAADILVIHPVESTWARINTGWATWLGAKDESVLKLEAQFLELTQWLLEAQIDFDYGDEGLLADHGDVHANSISVLHLGKQRYQTVVIAGIQTLRQSTLNILHRFRKAGGKIVFAGECPAYVDALPSQAPAELASQCIQTAWTHEAVTSAVMGLSKQSLQIQTEGDTLPTHKVMSQVREEPEDTWIVLLNTRKDQELDRLNLSIESAGSFLTEYDCRTGRRIERSFTKQGKRIAWKSSLAEAGERVFRISSTPIECEALKEPLEVSNTQSIDGPFDYELNEPNALILDRPEYKLATDEWQAAEDILIIDSEIRDSMGIEHRGGTMVQPWLKQNETHGTTKELRLRYRFEIETLPGSIELALEQPEHFEIRVNDTELNDAFTTGYWVDPAIHRVRVPSELLKTGRNQIELKVNFNKDTDLEAIYLLGNFGVNYDQGDTPTIGHLPDRIAPTDLCNQGLPHYTGAITYMLPLFNTGKARKLDFGTFGGAVISVKAGDHSETLCFPPFETSIPRNSEHAEITVWLTRRNLFGPLHIIPEEQSHIGPDSFRSSGNEYQESPVLTHSGLLQPPVLKS
jgi:hypothetical protein